MIIIVTNGGAWLHLIKSVARQATGLLPAVFFFMGPPCFIRVPPNRLLAHSGQIKDSLAGPTARVACDASPRLALYVVRRRFQLHRLNPRGDMRYGGCSLQTARLSPLPPSPRRSKDRRRAGRCIPPKDFVPFRVWANRGPTCG